MRELEKSIKSISIISLYVRQHLKAPPLFDNPSRRLDDEDYVDNRHCPSAAHINIWLDNNPHPAYPY